MTKKYTDYLDADGLLTLTDEFELRVFTWQKWEGIAGLLEDESVDDEDAKRRLPSLTPGSCGYCIIDGDNNCMDCLLALGELCSGGMGGAFRAVEDFSDGVPCRSAAAEGARLLADAIANDLERSEG